MLLDLAGPGVQDGHLLHAPVQIASNECHVRASFRKCCRGRQPSSSPNAFSWHQLTALRVYADQVVIPTLRRWDQRPDENKAIAVLKDWRDTGRITLVVSAVHDRETATPEQYREEQAKILALFPRVEFADDHRLIGVSTGVSTMYAGPGGRGGFTTHPLIEDDASGATPPRDRPRPARRPPRYVRDQARVRRVRHLRRGHDLEVPGAGRSGVPIRLMLPSEFIRRHTDTLDPRGPQGNEGLL